MSLQLKSYRERMGEGALARRAAKVQRRKSFRAEAHGILTELGGSMDDTQATILLMRADLLWILSVVRRTFWGRVKFFFLGR